MKSKLKTAILIVFLLSITVLFLSGCTQDNPIGTNVEDDNDIEVSEQPTVQEETDWKDISIKDVKTGESFKISDFKGKPVLIESFAVWCPTCKKQQDKIKELHEEVGDSFVSVSLDTDPNEDESKILGHIDRYGYTWRYAISPSEMTQKLIDEFGIGVINAPSSPIILVCEDQSSRFLDRGVKSVEDLKADLAQGC